MSEEKNNCFSVGQVLGLEYQGEIFELRIDDQEIADLVNAQIELEQSMLIAKERISDGFDQILCLAMEQEMDIDSIVQHCLTGK